MAESTSRTGSRPLPASLRMRKLDLNLPSDYVSRLDKAARRPVGLPRGPLGERSPAAETARTRAVSESAIRTFLKKAMATPTKIEIKGKAGRVEIGITGTTAQLDLPGPRSSRDRTSIGATAGYSGTFAVYKSRVYDLGPGAKLTEKISSATGQPFRLEYKHKRLAVALAFKSNDDKGMSFDRWEFTVSWEHAGPDMQSLGDVMKRGEKATREVFGALRQLDSLDDVRKVTEAIKDHIEPMQRTVQAASSLMKVRRGVNVSAKIEGPCQRVAMPHGASLEERRKQGAKGMIYLTVRF